MTARDEPQTAELQRELARARQRFEALIARASTPDAFSRQPPNGAWSAGQCLDHLNRTNAIYLPAIERAVAGAPPRPQPVTGEIRSTWFGRMFMRLVGEQVTSRGKAPARAVPHEHLDRDRVIAEFRERLGEIDAVLGRAASIDLNRATFASPFFKLSRVRAGTGFRIIIGHLHRHLGQAERALAANGL